MLNFKNLGSFAFIRGFDWYLVFGISPWNFNVNSFALRRPFSVIYGRFLPISAHTAFTDSEMLI